MELLHELTVRELVLIGTVALMVIMWAGTYISTGYAMYKSKKFSNKEYLMLTEILKEMPWWLKWINGAILLIMLALSQLPPAW